MSNTSEPQYDPDALKKDIEIAERNILRFEQAIITEKENIVVLRGLLKVAEMRK